jgi:anti-sigma regulatory factor (Ser/Thr protein kinase)
MTADTVFPDLYEGPGAKHQALIYANVDECVTSVLPYVQEGIEAGHSVFSANRAATNEALRDALGRDAASVRFVDAEMWYRKPSQTLARYVALVQSEVARGFPLVRVTAEVAWPQDNERLERAWTRYESIINMVLAPLPAWVVCGYNTSLLPASVIDAARSTHPDVVHEGLVSGSGTYQSVDEIFDRSAKTFAVPDGTPVVTFQPMDVGSAISHIERSARGAGLTERRVQDLAASASEVVTNAFLHAKTSVHVAVWNEGSDVICQIEDEGPGLVDRYIGYVPPKGSGGGWGLWLARQRADELEVGRGALGGAVRLRLRGIGADERPVRYSFGGI